MDAALFWKAAIFLAPTAVLLVVVVLLVTNARITVPVPALETMGAWWAHLFADEAAPPCPRCAKPARLLGRRGSVDWWYCPTCRTNPWHTAPPDASQRVAS